MSTTNNSPASHAPDSVGSGDSHNPPPILLTPDEVMEFRTLMREECRVEMEPGDAALRASELLGLLRVLLGPLPEESDG